LENIRKELTEVGDDPNLSNAIIEASKSSMGTDVSAVDILNIRSFAKRVIHLHKFRISLHQYLCSRMESCAPNLAALMGEQVGARLISKAGSLIKLAKYPASTVQILGAEKALFRALKSKGKCNTPKYGLIFNSSFITKALAKNKGRISRYLANKAAMACRLDCFLENPTNQYGLAFKEQVEQRLQFFKSGKLPDTNAAVMDKVRQGIVINDTDMKETTKDGETKKQKTKGKKRSRVEAELEIEEDEDKVTESTTSPSKKRKVKQTELTPQAAAFVEPTPTKTKASKDTEMDEESSDEAEDVVPTKQQDTAPKEEEEEQEQEQKPQTGKKIKKKKNKKPKKQ